MSKKLMPDLRGGNAGAYCNTPLQVVVVVISYLCVLVSAVHSEDTIDVELVGDELHFDVMSSGMLPLPQRLNRDMSLILISDL